MGCVCCSLSSFVSIVLHSLERITLCTVCAALVCCILFTILSVLVMGIGIGFHYCTVQNSVDAMAAAAKAASAVDVRRSGGGETRKKEILRSVNQAVKRGFAHRLGKRERANDLMPSNNNTINDQILLTSNSSQMASSSNESLSQDAEMRGFVNRFSKRDLMLSHNNTANYQKVAQNFNETSSLLEQGYNDTISILTGTFGRSRRKRDLTHRGILNNTLLNLTDSNDHVFLNVAMKQNYSVEISHLEKEMPDDTSTLSNNSIQDVILTRPNCTLLSFFSMFF